MQRGRVGGDGLLESPHLSSAHSCCWDLAAALTGEHGALLAIRPKARVPGAASANPSSSSPPPPLALSPPPESWCAPSGVRVAGGPGLREPLLRGTPVNQGHLGAGEPGGPPRKRASRDPPQAQPQREQGQARPGQEQRPPAHVRLSVRPSGTGRQAGARARVASQARQWPPRSRRGQVWPPPLAV